MSSAEIFDSLALLSSLELSVPSRQWARPRLMSVLVEKSPSTQLSLLRAQIDLSPVSQSLSKMEMISRNWPSSRSILTRLSKICSQRSVFCSKHSRLFPSSPILALHCHLYSCWCTWIRLQPCSQGPNRKLLFTELSANVFPPKNKQLHQKDVSKDPPNNNRPRLSVVANHLQHPVHLTKDAPSDQSMDLLSPAKTIILNIKTGRSLLKCALSRLILSYTNSSSISNLIIESKYTFLVLFPPIRDSLITLTTTTTMEIFSFSRSSFFDPLFLI